MKDTTTPNAIEDCSTVTVLSDESCEENVSK